MIKYYDMVVQLCFSQESNSRYIVELCKYAQLCKMFFWLKIVSLYLTSQDVFLAKGKIDFKATMKSGALATIEAELNNELALTYHRLRHCKVPDVDIEGVFPDGPDVEEHFDSEDFDEVLIDEIGGILNLRSQDYAKQAEIEEQGNIATYDSDGDVVFQGGGSEITQPVYGSKYFEDPYFKIATKGTPGNASARQSNWKNLTIQYIENDDVGKLILYCSIHSATGKVCRYG